MRKRSVGKAGLLPLLFSRINRFEVKRGQARLPECELRTS